MFRIDEDTRVCHRAVAIDAEGNITTKGDNNEKADDDILIKVYHLFHETVNLATSGNYPPPPLNEMRKATKYLSVSSSLLLIPLFRYQHIVTDLFDFLFD